MFTSRRPAVADVAISLEDETQYQHLEREATPRVHGNEHHTAAEMMTSRNVVESELELSVGTT